MAEGMLFIGGDWVPSSTGAVIEVVSPHTEEVIGGVASPGPEDVDRAVDAAREAFDHGPWPRTDPSERIALVGKLAELYDGRREEIAQLVSAEMGSPITFSRSAQANLPGFMMRSMAAVGETYPWAETRKGFFGADIRVRRAPVGVVAAVIPWNMPVFMIVAKLVPALLAGCSVVLKPSPETALDALLFAELVDQAGFPPGVVSILPGDRMVGQYLVARPGVDKVSFTGSTAAGRQVAAACATRLAHVSLELGGKSAALVLDDADPRAVATGIKVAGLMNGGQACVAQTRVLLPRARYDEFAAAITAMVDGLAVGDPSDPATQLGPMVSRRQRDRIRDFVTSGQAQGARLVTGGAEPLFERGWYVRPTVFADVDNDMTIAREEIFGPVLSLIPCTDEADAVRIANDTQYGLSGSVWTPDVERGLAVSARVRSGTFGINQAYSMDPVAPFGGVKASGHGREFGREGIDSYVETTSVSVAPA